MSDELNVWDAAFIAWDGFPTDPSKIGDADQAAAAVIRDYGDRRDATARSEGHAKGYQQAIADVVEWLRERQRKSLNGHVLAGAALDITSRFGKGA